MKVLKRIVMITILALIIFLQPVSILALSNEKAYHAINEQAIVKSDNIEVSNITYVNNASTIDTPTFGLTGLIKSNSPFPKDVTLTSGFYTEDHQLITENITELSLIDDFPMSFSCMLPYDRVNTNYQVSEIKYYVLTVKEKSTTIVPPINKLHQQAAYSSYPYLIDHYDIKINVNENNTYDITETITTYFNKEHHDIIRNIPTVNKVKHFDDTESINYAKISNIKVNEEYTLNQNFDEYSIKIDNANKNILGEKKYKISYHYNIGQDSSKDYDEVCLNLIGQNWDTAIGYVTFEITMPKEFDTKKINFSDAKTDNIISDAITWEKNENKIYGVYHQTLEPHSALTMRIELEEGYFEISPILQGLDYLLFFIPLVCLVICISIWNKYGKDAKCLEVINQYSPQGLNSIEIALNYKGKVSEKDIISLLVYLANKGYIKIEENFNEHSLGDFSIYKIKDYDGTNTYEKMFLEDLFKYQKKRKRQNKQLSEREQEISLDENVVTSNELKYTFNKTIKKIKRSINSKKNTKKIFVKGTNKYNWLMYILMIITYFVTIGVPTYLYSSWMGVGITLIISALYLPFISISLFSNLSKKLKIYLLVFLLVHFTLTSYYMLPLGTAFSANYLYISAFIFSLICIFGMVICKISMPKRTAYGNELLGQIKGFKKFLENANIEELKSLVKDNPNYFYDILPYTYVFGISRKWINKFESIKFEKPNWYASKAQFNITSFGREINRIMFVAIHNMSSEDSLSSK